MSDNDDFFRVMQLLVAIVAGILLACVGILIVVLMLTATAWVWNLAP